MSLLGFLTIYNGAKLVLDKENMLIAFAITSQGKSIDSVCATSSITSRQIRFVS